ncbi:MAG: hypothetical protein R3F62_01935 [Planctomycetota bacterium]
MKDELVEFTFAGQVTPGPHRPRRMATVRVQAAFAPGLRLNARIPRKPKAMLARGRVFVPDPHTPWRSWT